MSAHLNAAQTRGNGWQVLPLPRNAKYPPPAGYTGKDGATESLDVPPGANYAIRLPPGVIAIDVDHGYPSTVDGRIKHGADTIMALTQRLGALPQTYILSSRDDRRSGQRFYRVGVDDVLLGEVPAVHGPDAAHSDVEILQHHHRYAVGPGSTIDGRTYELTGPGGAPMAAMPPPDVFPMLPKAWVRALSSTTQTRPTSTTREAIAPVPARQLSFEQASEVYARAVLAFSQATAPGFNAKLFKFLSVSKAFWLAQGLTAEQWFDTAENELLAHPYYGDGGIWSGLDDNDVRVIGEVLHRSQIVWRFVTPDPEPDLPFDAQPTGVYIITEPWNCAAGPTNPRAVALAWLALTRQRLHFWRGQFYRYSSGRWKPWEEGELMKILLHDLAMAHYPKVVKGELKDIAFTPTPKNLSDVRKMLEYLSVRQDHWGLDRCVVFENGVLDLTSGQLSDHTPDVFNLHKIQATYQPDAACPEWLAFIGSSLPEEDQQAVLQELMGYLISGRQDLHKIFGFWGEPRSGKSTITRVLESILGKRSVTACRYSSILGSFGLQSHADSSVIVVTEARTTKETKSAVDLFLAISGCDPVEVNVKNKPLYTATLPGRLLMVSNGLPNVMDDSDAFASRFVHLMFLVSFLGREDHGLESRLLTELPGIVAWALRGLERLDQQGGRFTASARGKAADRILSVGSASMPTWFKDRIVQTGVWEDVILGSTIHANYVQWCSTHDVDEKYVSNRFQLGKWMTTRTGEQTTHVRVNGEIKRARRGLKFVVPPLLEVPSYLVEPGSTVG